MGDKTPDMSQVLAFIEFRKENADWLEGMDELTVSRIFYHGWSAALIWEGESDE